ncbi:MAG: hypothetical protein AAF587_18750 [Bacteroidota bacterium]
MKEKNQDTLKDALKRLPNYQPEDKLWKALEQDLHAEEEDDLHKEEFVAAVHRLPRYRAPHDIWTKIEEKLSRKPVFLQRKWTIAAAIVGLLILGVSSWMIFGNQSKLASTPTVSEKKAETPITLEEVERATYGEELEEVYQSIEACLELKGKAEQQSFSQTKTELKQLKSDSLHLSKIKGLQQKICGSDS